MTTEIEACIFSATPVFRRSPFRKNPAMPTVRWECRKTLPHYYFHSFERFQMFETIKDLELLLLLLLEEAADGKSGGFLLLCLTSFTMLALQDDLNRLQPSNMYPPEGFYPSGSNDPFWSWHYDLFKHKFRFRLELFHRLTPAIY